MKFVQSVFVVFACLPGCVTFTGGHFADQHVRTRFQEDWSQVNERLLGYLRVEKFDGDVSQMKHEQYEPYLRELQAELGTERVDRVLADIAHFDEAKLMVTKDTFCLCYHSSDDLRTFCDDAITSLGVKMYEGDLGKNLVRAAEDFGCPHIAK